MLFRSFQGKVRKLHCLEFLRNQQMINKKKVRKAWKGQAKTDCGLTCTLPGQTVAGILVASSGVARRVCQVVIKNGSRATDLWVQMKKNIMIKILLMSLVGLIM